MSKAKTGVPDFTTNDAVNLADTYFGWKATASPLPSYIDQNFKITNIDTDRSFILKISNSGEREEVLNLQHQAMRHLNRHNVSCSQPMITVQGRYITQITASNGAQFLMHALTWLPGQFLAEVKPHGEKILHLFGRFMGSVAQGFKDFYHPAMDRQISWDLKHALKAMDHVGAISSIQKRAMVCMFMDRFRDMVHPIFSSLRSGVIHGDGNDYNVLTDKKGELITGIIDFGDMSHSAIIGEAAVAVAYAMLDKPDPLEAACHFVAGFHEVFPLNDSELSVLFHLICARLCVSVISSARQAALRPDNAYLQVSEEPSWRLLTQLSEIDPNLAYYAFRHACKFPPVPQAGKIISWLMANPAAIGPVLEEPLQSSQKLVFDFSAGADNMQAYEGKDVEWVTDFMFKKMEEAGATVAIGKYDEERDIYKTPQFAPPDGGEARTIHIGIDIFARAGTPILAPLDGKIHSFQNNAAALDYGPTIILEHQTSEGAPFYTLYGHLSQDSLDGLTIHQEIKQGQTLAKIGDHSVNGGWVPHLHFQIITDMLGRYGDFAGVSTKSMRALWLKLCPDPNLILRYPEAERRETPKALLKARQRHLGKMLSVSYKKPLKIVRGSGQYLYDENGHAFLDMVNNVCHVGHCHPRVVEAATRQISALNTNTRYLHDNLPNYAQRLCATFPEPLNVCFLVNSGSEANDLALRLARNFTGRRSMVVVEGAYHGHLTSLIDLSPYKFDGPGGAGCPDDVYMAPMPDVFRGEHHRDDPLAGSKYAKHVAEGFENLQAKGAPGAAFICESLLGCGGQIVLPQGYLKAAFQHAREAGALCIADEVQVGFGRVGQHFWGFQTQDVIPDIVTLGKPIGNGHPMAAVITTSEIAQAFHNGMEYFNTYGGNPVSCAVGAAVLDVIEDECLQEHAWVVGDFILRGLRELQKRHPLIGDVRGLGLYIGVELVRDHDTLEPADWEASSIVEEMKERGILLSTDGPLHNVLKIKPPMVFTKENAQTFLENLDQVLKQELRRPTT